MHRLKFLTCLRTYLRQRHELRAVLVALSVLLAGYFTQAQTTEPSYGLPTQLSAQASVSFLASEPHAAEVYTLYGHAGLRVQDPRQGFDITFNYGLFDFAEDFLWRFIQGKTDYIVAPIATRDYFAEYLQYGAVHEVTFATDSLQRDRLWKQLLENIQPAQRVYRYDAFRNNCSTRPLDLILSALHPQGDSQATGDTLALISQDEAVRHVLAPQSWRAVINRLEASSPWLVLGTDLAMGTQLDAPMSLREHFFIPTDATTLLPHLRYGRSDQDATTWVSLVSQTETYGQSQPIPTEDAWAKHPAFTFGLLALICLGWGVARRNGKRLPYILEAIVFTVAGLAGALLFFLVFISEHPMITTNWNLLVLHPFYLLFPLLALGRRHTASLRYRLHALSSLSLLAFPLVSWGAGQVINPSVYLIALALLMLHLGQMKARPSSFPRSYAYEEN